MTEPATRQSTMTTSTGPQSTGLNWALQGLCVLGLSAAACTGPSSSSDEREAARQATDTVAIFDGGRVSSAQVDQAILALPPAERDEYRGSELEKYRQLVRNLAVDQLLRSNSVSSGFSKSTEYTNELEEMRRQVLVQQCLMASPPPVEVPSDAEVRQHYGQSKAARGEAEQRFVLTIFRRHREGTETETLVAELAAMRQRVLDGESFELLAREQNDSEARHLDGAIGWVSPGQLSPELDKIIFELPEETPSQPIVSASGVHLFYVGTELGGSVPAFESVAQTIRQSLLRQRQQQALLDLVADTELPPEALLPNREQLGELLRQAEEDTELLRVGDFSLTLGQLQQRVAREQRKQDGQAVPGSQRLRAVFNAIKQREILYHRFTSAGETLRPEIRQRFERQAEVLLVQRYSEDLLQQRLDELESELVEFHQRRQQRFATLLELRLEALVVPHGDRPARVMEVLEGQAEALAAGEATLQQLAQELGGELQVSDWVDINTLTAFRAKAAFFAPGIATGGFSPPYNTGRTIELFRVLERREPQPLDYETARPQVRDAYLERHGQVLYDELVAQLLQDVSFKVLEPRLSTLASGLASSQRSGAAPAAAEGGT